MPYSSCAALFQFSAASTSPVWGSGGYDPLSLFLHSWRITFQENPMSHRFLYSVVTAALLCLAPPATAHAQIDAPTLIPRGDVFAGVAFWDEAPTNLCGLHIAGTWRAGKTVGIVADMVIYGDATTLMGGLRVQSSGRHPIFGQFLIGSAPLSTIALQPGVGVDIRFSRRVAVRTAGDLKISGDDGKTFYGTRLTVGVVFLLGQQ